MTVSSLERVKLRSWTKGSQTVTNIKDMTICTLEYWIRRNPSPPILALRTRTIHWGVSDQPRKKKKPKNILSLGILITNAHTNDLTLKYQMNKHPPTLKCSSQLFKTFFNCLTHPTPILMINFFFEESLLHWNQNRGRIKFLSKKRLHRKRKHPEKIHKTRIKQSIKQE